MEAIEQDLPESTCKPRTPLARAGGMQANPITAKEGYQIMTVLSRPVTNHLLPNILSLTCEEHTQYGKKKGFIKIRDPIKD
jgi:hypothetical protein